jgi:hypothetical protein
MPMESSRAISVVRIERKAVISDLPPPPIRCDGPERAGLEGRPSSPKPPEDTNLRGRFKGQDPVAPIRSTSVDQPLAGALGTALAS